LVLAGSCYAKVFIVILLLRFPEFVGGIWSDDCVSHNSFLLGVEIFPCLGFLSRYPVVVEVVLDLMFGMEHLSNILAFNIIKPFEVS